VCGAPEDEWAQTWTLIVSTRKVSNAKAFHLTAVIVRDTVPARSGRVQESRPLQMHGAAFLLPAKKPPNEEGPWGIAYS